MEDMAQLRFVFYIQHAHLHCISVHMFNMQHLRKDDKQFKIKQGKPTHPFKLVSSIPGHHHGVSGRSRVQDSSERQKAVRPGDDDPSGRQSAADCVELQQRQLLSRTNRKGEFVPKVSIHLNMVSYLLSEHQQLISTVG